jgi:hypothetical protein
MSPAVREEIRVDAAEPRLDEPYKSFAAALNPLMLVSKDDLWMIFTSPEMTFGIHSNLNGPINDMQEFFCEAQTI